MECIFTESQIMNRVPPRQITSKFFESEAQEETPPMLLLPEEDAEGPITHVTGPRNDAF